MDRGRPKARSEGHPLLGPVASFTTRRPKLVVIVWVVAMGALALIGNGLQDKVSSGGVFVAGTPAERAHEIAEREFGREETLVVMLRGPRDDLERDGPALVEQLRGIPQTLVISPWSARGAIKGLRPSPRVAALLISVGGSGAGSSDAAARVEGLIDEEVDRPVRASVAGAPAIASSLRDTIEKASKFGERLAIPVLLIVLLIVCRSVLAAAMPVVIGGMVAAATRGILYLLAGSVTIDSIALGIAGMIGLALGVDYSLLIVARFREEIEKGTDIERAVRTTVMSTGRAILPAGSGLILALLSALFLLPGSFIASVVLAATSATVLSVLSAMLLAPAALMLLGTRLNKWSLPRRRPGGAFVMGWSRRLSRRPGFVLAILFVLFLCSAWAFTLQTNVGVASLLPEDDPGRKAQEQIEQDLGPGWVGPFEVVVADDAEPITTRKRLRELAAFQRHVEADPGVSAMAGFATLEEATDALAAVPDDLERQERSAARLSNNLGRLERGAGASAEGYRQAAGGAAELASATESAGSGSERLAGGLQASADGSRRLSDGLGAASGGSADLSEAARKTSTGAGRLADKVAGAEEQTAEAIEASAPLRNALVAGERSAAGAPLQETETQLDAAWDALQRMAAGREDPQYQTAVKALREATRGLTGLDPETEEGSTPGSIAGSLGDAVGQFELALYLSRKQEQRQREAKDGIGKLGDASARLDRGLGRLLDGSRELRRAVGRLSQKSEALPAGLGRLGAGADQLLAGLGQIESGAGELSGRLADGAGRTDGLSDALRRMQSATAGQGTGGTPFQESPRFFDSGYYYLAGLDGTPPERRSQVGFLVNIAQGGSAARMLVVPTDGAATAGATETEQRLTDGAEELARKTGAEVVVGGLSPSLVELDSAVRDQTPHARLVLSLVTILILLFVTRSLTLPLIAALLNLLTVSVTFGLLSLLFNGSLLGGPGFVDSSVIPGTVVLTFGLAIDYEVFILARIREEYLRTGSTSRGIDEGLARTAPVISGAAMIMIGVFLAFAISDLMLLRNLGVALAVGVIIDAYVVRFLLLPAIMRALGDRCWWLPRWLDRLLPGSALPKRARGSDEAYG
jgi:putative drug exporter of the RND superfamily